MKRRARFWTSLLLVLTACVGAAGCSRMVTGHAIVASDRETANSELSFTQPELDRLLLSDAQISTIMVARSMATYRVYTNIPVQPGEVYSHPECAVALFNTTIPAYSTSDDVGVRGKKISEPGGVAAHDIDEAVVAFQTPSEARTFVDYATQSWHTCAGLNVTYAGTDGLQLPWSLGTPRTVGEIIAITNESTGGWSCAHAMATRSNIVVDVDACGSNITDQAIAIVKAITTVAQ